MITIRLISTIRARRWWSLSWRRRARARSLAAVPQRAPSESSAAGFCTATTTTTTTRAPERAPQAVSRAACRPRRQSRTLVSAGSLAGWLAGWLASSWPKSRVNFCQFFKPPDERWTICAIAHRAGRRLLHRPIGPPRLERVSLASELVCPARRTSNRTTFAADSPIFD